MQPELNHLIQDWNDSSEAMKKQIQKTYRQEIQNVSTCSISIF